MNIRNPPASGYFYHAKVIHFHANSFIRLFPPPAIRQDYRWKFIRTCCVTPAALRWPIWVSIRALSRITSVTVTFAIPSGTRPATPDAFTGFGINPVRSRERRFSSKVTLRHGWRFVIGSPYYCQPLPAIPGKTVANLLCLGCDKKQLTSYIDFFLQNINKN